MCFGVGLSETRYSCPSRAPPLQDKMQDSGWIQKQFWGFASSDQNKLLARLILSS